MSTKVILVGCGNMGYAMVSGWLSAGRLKPSEVAVVEPDEKLRQRAAGLGAIVAAAAEDLPASDPLLVVIAVKPQVISAVLGAYAPFAASGATFLSVAAGTPIAQFEKMLGAETPIVRCMPNTPAAIGRGMLVTVANAHVRTETKAFIESLLSASGEVAEIGDEAQMDAVTAVSGSGPAYIFHFIECLTAAGEQAGLPSEIAVRLARQTVYGAASLAAQSNENASELRRQVTSPNGTTAAALSVLMDEDRLQSLLTSAVLAARDRSAELGRG